jgi:hypothetical protein
MDKAKVYDLKLGCILLSPPLIVDCRCCQTLLLLLFPWPNQTVQAFRRHQGNAPSALSHSVANLSE